MSDAGSVIKIVWGVILVVIFLANNIKRKKQKRTSQVDSREGTEVIHPKDLKQIWKEELQRQAEMVRRSSQPEDVEQNEMVEAKAPNKDKSVTSSKEPKTMVATQKVEEPKANKFRDFDLRRAVIETEILNPKFKGLS